MRVVSLEKGAELTLISDQPTTMYITTRMSDDAGSCTKITRAFMWEEPADPEIAQPMRQILEAIVLAGEGEIKSIFDDA